MKSTSIKLATVAAITAAFFASGCSSTRGTQQAGSGGQITPVVAQQLSSNFTRRGIKIEFDCVWGTGWSDYTCVKTDIKAIEATAYATSNGNSENNRETAFKVAELKAKAKLRHFVHEDVQSTSVTRTIAKNIEKANDRIKQRVANGEEVAMSDTEAEKDTNWVVRENINDMTREVTETVRTQAVGILRGVQIKSERVVDRQTVEVVIRWDKDSDAAAKHFNKIFR